MQLQLNVKENGKWITKKTFEVSDIIKAIEYDFMMEDLGYESDLTPNDFVLDTIKNMSREDLSKIAQIIFKIRKK